MSSLQELRKTKDEFFRDHPQSPLTHEQRETFTGLDYFPENPDLRLVVAIDEIENNETIQVQTSTGDIQVYQRYGTFDFDVESQPATLTIYMNQYGFFLPFVDSLANDETYGAGRYLEPEPQPDGRFLIDFNLAYNPYCAYSEQYSCPLPPLENWLKAPVRAGEKSYKQTHN